MCGVFGIIGNEEAANLAYLGLYALQHRGQESVGIVSSDGQKIYQHRGMGHVSDVFKNGYLSALPGSMAIGHVRYSTAGESSLANAQPLLVDCQHGQIALCLNGNLINASTIRNALIEEGAIFTTTVDTEVLLHLFAKSKAKTSVDALIESALRVHGAFSILAATPNELIAIRDPHGFRPLVIGRLDDAWIVCSETCALDLINATYVRDVEPGEIVVFSKHNNKSIKPFPGICRTHCIFEHVYFARPDSVVFGESVDTVRTNLGRALALESPVNADVVVAVPDSGTCAAIGFSEASGICKRPGLTRNHYVGRTFIQPNQQTRDLGVRIKLNPVRSILVGKRVVLIDDSIVRGTTSRNIVRMLKDAGATEVHVRISCPPVIAPCYYGIDTPKRKNLIASVKSVEEIREFIGADSLHFLSLEGMKAATAKGSDYCTACYTNIYPCGQPGNPDFPCGAR